MKITYISHSGFAVELENHIFLFDYYKGEIPKFDPKKSIVVFASHVHHDHYVEEIFELREQYSHRPCQCLPRREIPRITRFPEHGSHSDASAPPR